MFDRGAGLVPMDVDLVSQGKKGTGKGKGKQGGGKGKGW